jgi:3',5'-cyclic AMP phosphodiesterase CpdA
MKMMKTACKLLVVVVVVFAVCFAATKAGKAGAPPRAAIFRPPPVRGAVPWTHTRFENDPRDFQFAIVSDLNGGYRAGVFPEAVKKLNLLHPEFVISIGDLIDGGVHTPAVLAEEWKEFDAFVAELRMPFFYVSGNHDVNVPLKRKIWQRRYGEPYYHFLYQDVLFLVLDTGDYGEMPDVQIEYVRKVLSDNPSPRWTLVFMHQPVWLYKKLYKKDTGWEKIEPLLKGRNHTAFAGHWHQYQKYVRGGQTYVVLASTGGASKLRGPKFGEFDHVVWVTMTDKGPIIANLMLDGIYDENIRVMK